jgi:hypothetical protein
MDDFKDYMSGYGKIPNYLKKDYTIKKDVVNKPQHYTFGGIETIDYLQAKLTAEQFEGYLLGNILKYTSRYSHKNGIEDLRKAEWYLKKLIGVKEK